MRQSHDAGCNAQQEELPNMTRSRSSGAQARVAKLLLVLAVLLCASAVRAEPASPRPVVGATKHMVAAANPRAAQAGLAVLRDGGSAVDAAIAVQMVLGLVEPQASGIGGGGFLVHYSAVDRKVRTYDGREVAPAAARTSHFLAPDGKPLAFRNAIMGGQSVGVPGILRMLQMAHRVHGRLPWARLFVPAITLAETGFPMSPRLHRQLASATDLRQSEHALDYFYEPDGTLKPVGARMVNQAYADTLRAIAQGGADVFYNGDIARDIVAAVRHAQANAGRMREADLAGYRAKERPPVCGRYRGYTICSMGPPSSGGITVLQILGILQHFELGTMHSGSVQALHLFSEAGRLAYADRELYMADADFVPVPTRGLLDPAYLKGRAELIRLDKTMGQASPGQPPRTSARWWGRETSPEFPSTSHIAVVDAAGNAVSMTTTIEAAFGSRLMVRGFFLNNQLTDFSFTSGNRGRLVANRPEPGKRPRSSMAPVVVLRKDGRLMLVLGSAGGSAIINYVAKTLVGILDWGLDIQRAIDLPNMGNRGGATELEENSAIENLQGDLETKGHEVSVIPLESGLHAIAVTVSGLAGGADSRREGVALGD